MRQSIAASVQDAIIRAKKQRVIDLEKRDRNQRLKGSAPRSGAGLVPYTTSHTAPGGAHSDFVCLSQAHSRLLRLKHHIRTASRLVRESMRRGGRKWRAVFVTLTYRPGVEWDAKHVAGYLNAARMWASRQGVRLAYVWVAEMQQRGAVHYHLVMWLPSGLRLPRPDGRKGWWRHGSSNVQTVKRNAVGYLMKYVSKGVRWDDPPLPRGCRVCGSGGLDELARAEFHYWRLPRYVRDLLDSEVMGPHQSGEVVRGIGIRAARLPGGGWWSRGSGRSVRSDFGMFGIASVSRGDRSDRVTMLHKQYKREKGGRGWDGALTSQVVELWKEEAFELVGECFIDLALQFGWNEVVGQ